MQLAAGLAFICSAKTQPGIVNHQCYGSINLANYSCRDEAQMQAVVEEFRQAGIETGCPMPKLEMLEAELRFFGG